MSALSHVIMTLSVIYEGLVDLYSEQCRILSRSSHHLLFCLHTSSSATMESISPFARSPAFDGNLTLREQTVSPSKGRYCGGVY